MSPRERRVAPRVRIVHPHHHDAEEFLAAVSASRAFHRGWVTPPRDRETYLSWVERQRPPHNESFFVRRLEDDALAGYASLSVITRGPLQSAYLGFYGLAPYHAQGFMHEGLQLVLRHAFTKLRLHRVEANIQPTNERSRTLAERCGFALEGYSPRYLKIAGRWRDHERWALLVDDWKRSRRKA